MPRINRMNDINYTIVLISHITDDSIRLLDLTTDKNYRNYKWAINNSIVKDTKKTNVVVNEIRKCGIINFKFEKLEYYYGQYNDAVKKLNSVSNTLNILSNYSVSNEIIQLRNKISKDTPENAVEITEITEITEDEDPVKKLMNVVIENVVKNNTTAKVTKVKKATKTELIE